MVRAARLRRSGDIEKLRNVARSDRRASFSARIRATDTSEARLAVSAPRSAGTAVVRNRARRRVREAFRRAAAADAGPGGADVLVTVRREAAEGDFAALVADAAAVLRERRA